MPELPAHRHKNLFARVFGVLMVAGGAALLLYHWEMFGQAAEGAKAVTPAQLASADGPGDLPSDWVVFSPDQIVSPNITQVEGTKIKRQVYYHLLRVGDRWAVLRSTSRTLLGRITATATTSDFATGEDGAAKAVAEALRQRAKGRVLAYSFDNVSSPSSDIAIIGSLVFVLLVFGAIVACGLFDTSSEVEQEDEYADAVAYWPAAPAHRW
jgi:hypothetical protein